MTEQEQRIAIAKFCGWTKLRDVDGGRPLGVPPSEITSKPTPNYLHDLNAMHDAEEKLSEDKRTGYGGYLNKLWDVCDRKAGPRMSTWHTTHATAAQRAEALLRTMGKWTDSPSKSACQPAISGTTVLL